MSYDLILTRKKTDEVHGTTGLLMAKGGPIIGDTLELPYRDNRPFISSVPAGLYECAVYTSKTHGITLILDVPDRSYILIHSGTKLKHTEGCILLQPDAYTFFKHLLKEMHRYKPVIKLMIVEEYNNGKTETP